jgi:hypothetical protein
MSPKLESRVRDVLTRVLSREDFPEVLLDPVSTYLVTGVARVVVDNFPPGHELQVTYTSVYWLLYYIMRGGDSDIRYYVREVRQTFKLYDS